MMEIIIIGAGAAGIAAAAKLIENGIENVTILEAENRIGGRIHSIFLGDAFVDLGAEEVHGIEGNAVVKLAESYLKKKTPLTKSTYYYSNGQKIEQEFCDAIMKCIEDFCEEDTQVKESIGKVFTDRYTSTILTEYKNDDEKLKKAKEFLPICEAFFQILDGPFSWFDVVVESGSHYVSCEGDQFMGWNGNGCKTILSILMKEIPRKENCILSDNHIKLNKTVRKILWNSCDKVQCICEDGTKYTADHIIFTPSVGVLREKHKELFEPNLPKEKSDILHEIGYCNIIKVALKFSKKWWNTGPFGFVWNEEDKEAVKMEYKNVPLIVNDASWITAIHWLIEAPDNNRVLVAWLTGPATPSIEKLDNDQIKDGLMYVIRRFLGKNFDIPEPDTIIPTRWFSNSNFCGTYSYETVEASKLQIPLQKVLEQPLTNEQGIPVVLFAGEATHVSQYSTVNGAILSGFREANRIVDIYKTN
ncbi:hypothetical protein HHI36_000401 [Cryptolaemus montrouzieri]|uniref:Amine oxidase domain-containing protein n=1 Tax=Cryptolaemus montrouzieri TaxID=559131 RepID=A0ABD2P582_9CUCU